MTQLYNVPQQQKVSRYMRNSTFCFSSNSSFEDDANAKMQEEALKNYKKTLLSLNDQGLLSQPTADYILSQQMGNLSSEELLKLTQELHSNHIFKHAEESYHRLDDPNDGFDNPEYFITDLVDLSWDTPRKIETQLSNSTYMGSIVENTKIQDMNDAENDNHDTG